jgi:hypothetical protein
MRRSSCAASLLVLASAAATADIAERPFYAAVEMLPSEFTSTVEGVNGTFHGSDSAPNLGVAVGLRWSFARSGASMGPVLGVELATERAEFETGDHTASELRAAAFWAVAIDRDWTAQAGMRAGYGLSTLDLAATPTSIGFSGDGTGWSMEPGAEVLWSFAPRWRLSLGAGWRSASYSYSSDGLDLTLDNSGLSVRAGLEWQLSVAPGTLE